VRNAESASETTFAAYESKTQIDLFDCDSQMTRNARRYLRTMKIRKRSASQASSRNETSD